ncbi:MAG TPA: TonB family protein [Longimicrobium sp.]|nr:TonB family protein [Longimicrobium sp.]
MKHLLLAAALCCAAAPGLAQDAPAADAGRVYELAEVETPPRPSNVDSLRAALQASYPPALLQAGAGGRVHVAFVVAADGTVGQAQVISSTDPAFDAPTLASVAVLRFTPGMRGGSPVATRVEIPIDWRAPPPAPDAVSAGAASPPARAADEAGVEEGTYELAAIEVAPRPRNLGDVRRAMQRLYPRHAHPARAAVQVKFRVDAEGVPGPGTITSSTDGRFNRVSLEVAAVMRFSPARVRGRAVPVWVELPLQWEPVVESRSTSPFDREGELR